MNTSSAFSNIPNIEKKKPIIRYVLRIIFLKILTESAVGNEYDIARFNIYRCDRRIIIGKGFSNVDEGGYLSIKPANIFN
jgi:hypothetical protein